MLFFNDFFFDKIRKKQVWQHKFFFASVADRSFLPTNKYLKDFCWVNWNQKSLRCA